MTKLEQKPAYSIDELAKAGPLRRSTLYKAIKEKRLVARKFGRRTLITHDDYQSFVAGLTEQALSPPRDRPSTVKAPGLAGSMNDHVAMLAIQEELDGSEWTSGTLQRIAAIMIDAGYRIRDLDD